jgi:putative restriction endonuclease
MKFYIGVTDNSWFNFLSELRPDEVNFWQPSGNKDFHNLKPGELFLFKLKAPHNAIAGGGFFVSHSRIPLSLAWEAFENKNGTDDFSALREKILSLRQGEARLDPDPTIGCIILNQPFFLPREAWIPAPENWSSNIVQGKTYTTQDPIGRALWDKVEDRFRRNILSPQEAQVHEKEGDRYGAEYLISPRLGQGGFRILVTDAYNRRCAMTGERTLPVLESAHIKPYALSGPHNINNGLLLRSDLHKLFDQGLITVTKDYNIEVSSQIKSRFENGRDYYALHGRELVSLPVDSTSRPSTDYIDWHNEKIYVP